MSLPKPDSYLSMVAQAVKFNPYNSNTPPGSKDFLVTLTCEGRSMEVYQTTGPGTGDPVLDHVVGFLIDDVKGALAPWDPSKKDWWQRFDHNAMEVRATKFATLIGTDRFNAVLKHLGIS